jgi:protein-S-isoprenylcysteine O-methyltransferase Ste14
VPGLALALLAVYGLVAFVGRALIQLRLTGSTGIKGVSGRFGSTERVPRVLFLAAIALCVIGPLLDESGPLEPIDSLDGDAGHAVGVALAATGLLATVGAQLAMGASWRVGVDPEERTRLVTDGPFALVRNPIYAGVIPFFAGIALLVPSSVTIAGALLIVVALELQTRLVEEPHLLRSHGREYADYAARVGRFVPGVGRIRR